MNTKEETLRMKDILWKEITRALDDPFAVKALATINEDGSPHVVFKNLMYTNQNGEIVLWELIESSKTNQNLVRSIWFDRKIAINVLCGNKKSYFIQGIPVRAIISGREFQKYYIEIREKYGKVDLSAVWIIKPESYKEKSLEKRVDEERAEHPLIMHLDCISK